MQDLTRPGNLLGQLLADSNPGSGNGPMFPGGPLPGVTVANPANAGGTADLPVNYPPPEIPVAHESWGGAGWKQAGEEGANPWRPDPVSGEVAEALHPLTSLPSRHPTTGQFLPRDAA